MCSFLVVIVLQITKEVYANASNRNCADCSVEGW